MKNRKDDAILKNVSAYISKSGAGELSAKVVQKAKLHILDTLAAVVSGSKLKPGQVAARYIKKQGGAKEALVIGSKTVTTAINAALANGMMAHADETDDSHARSRTHPGCAIVPAALAVSEREQANGIGFLRGVVAGYDIGCRITQALGPTHMRKKSRSSHSVGGIFGAAAAAASILGLAESQVRYVMSYAAQQASGVTSLFRDDEHIEKAFVFAGMPARDGVSAAIIVQSGFTGVWDCFSGRRNFFKAFSNTPSPELVIDGLGTRFEIMNTNIKKFCVGSPIQAPLEAMLTLIQKYRISPKDVKSIIAKLPDYGAVIVDDRSMPNINLQYILAVTLLDGQLSFEAAHSHERMKAPAVIELKRRIRLLQDPELSAAAIMRQGIVEVITKDAKVLREHVVSVRGTAENPMTAEEVEIKSKELLLPVLGKARSQKLIKSILNLEKIKNMRSLRPLLTA